MQNETDIRILQSRFGNIITTDSEGVLRPCSIIDGFAFTVEIISLIKKIELIIRLKGFIRGYKESNGKWMRKEDIIRIIREDPQWLRTNLVAQEYGI